MSPEVADLFALTNLAGADHVTYDDAPGWLVAVQLHFAEGSLSVEVNPGEDTVEITFDRTSRPELVHWTADTVRHDATDRYADVLGRSSSWRWTLSNQQGYQDGFQIEFRPPESTVTIQYLALGSRLHMRNVGPTRPAQAVPPITELSGDGVPAEVGSP